MSSANLFFEFRQSSLKLDDGTAAIELPIHRLENGKLANRIELIAGIRGFAGKRRHARSRAICAIGARGVSLRRVTLPAAPKENFHQLLTFQVEKEFPLPPAELAWGCYESAFNGAPVNPQSAATHDVVIAAVKKENISEYFDLLKACELDPVFTVGLFAAIELCPKTHGSYALLDIGPTHSELIAIENGLPTSIRTIAWGSQNVVHSVAQTLESTPQAAEALLHDSNTSSPRAGNGKEQEQQAIDSAFGCLAESIRNSWSGRVLYITGQNSTHTRAAHLLTRLLGTSCEPIHLPQNGGTSPAILGLKQLSTRNNACPSLVLDVSEAATAPAKTIRPSHWKWAALAAALAIASMSLRYAGAFLKQNGLSQQLQRLNAERERLPRIDRELTFLQYLETNQPPYLSALAILANAAAPGTRVESISMNRRGDLSLRAAMQNSQQAIDLRSKLIESGLFTSVVVDEQTPGQDRQRINVRMSARWKPTKTLNFLEKTNVPPASQPAPQKR